MLIFLFDFGSFWAPFWAPLGRHLGLQIAPKSIQKSIQNQLVPTYPEESASRGPKTAPRGPRTPPRGLKIAPRGPQVPPKGPKKEPKPAPTPQFGPGMPQDGPKRHHFSPNRIFPIFYLCSRSSISLYLRKDSTKLSRSYQEAPKSFANQHIIISELPSLQVSELPVSRCLGGIREA